MSGRRKVAAVVVTYNRASQLTRCMDALLAQAGAACDGIIVLDNNSTDDTEAMLAPYVHRHDVVHVNAGTNLGSAGGFHLGVYEAVMRGYDLIWVMDDDVVPSSGALRALLDADDTLGGEWGFLSSVAYWTDGSVCKPNVQKKGLFTFVGADDYERPLTEVKIAAMASLMLRADVVREVGLPIAEYCIYTDDYEYTGRISEKHPCYMVTASRVTHEMARNEKPDLVRGEPDRMWRYRYLYRNDVHFYRRYGVRGLAYLAAKTAYTTMNVLLHERQEKLGKLELLWRSLGEGTRFNPQIIYPRTNDDAARK